MSKKTKHNPGSKSIAGPEVLHVPARFNEALSLHQKGQLAQAQAIYEDIIRTRPGHFDSLHLLGVIAYQKRDYQRAVDLIEKGNGA